MVFQDCSQLEVTIFHSSGALVPVEELRNIVMYIPWGGTNSGLMLHSFFLIAPPLFLHSLTSLISNCLDLHFGTRKRS